MARKNPNSGTNVLTLVLIFLIGFAVFSLTGFVILIILLSAGILPTM